MNEARNTAGQGAVSVTHAADSNLLIKLSGPWHLTRDVPSEKRTPTKIVIALKASDRDPGSRGNKPSLANAMISTRTRLYVGLDHSASKLVNVIAPLSIAEKKNRTNLMT